MKEKVYPNNNKYKILYGNLNGTPIKILKSIYAQTFQCN